jgi:hypothetical protein
MTEEFDNINPEGEETPDIGSAFDAMESEINADLPEGSFVTLRSGANAPRYAPVYEGETAVPIKILADRAGLTFGGSIDIYVDGGKVTFDTPVVAGSVITFVGNVKGGVA